MMVAGLGAVSLPTGLGPVILPAMHVPDGFLDVQTSVLTALLAVAAVALSLRRAQPEHGDAGLPLAGLTAAFIFAAQMINFPVGVGTSGHLIGGALAVVLVGPWTAVLVMSVVLGVQSLLFADGGLTAIGTNILLLGVVPVVVAWLTVRAVMALAPRRPSSVVLAAGLAGLVSVPAAAAAFVGLYAVGGQAELPMGALLAAMLGWHVLIGAGEAVITAVVVGAVMAVRPDLVHAARGQQVGAALTAGTSEGSSPEDVPLDLGRGLSGRRSRSPRTFALLSLGLALVLAGLVSAFASSRPDGLEHVASSSGFAGTAVEHRLGGLPLADYGAVGGIPVGLAGVLGVAAVLLLTGLIALWVRGRGQRRPARAASLPQSIEPDAMPGSRVG